MFHSLPPAVCTDRLFNHQLRQKSGSLRGYQLKVTNQNLFIILVSTRINML